MKFFLILLFIPFMALASPLDPSYEDLNPTTEDILIRKKEKYQREESMIYNFNSSLGIKDQRHYTGTDKNRIAFAGHLAADYEHFQNILGGEFSYMRRTDSFSRIWYGGQVFTHTAAFDAITQRPTKVSTSPTAESNLIRTGDAKNTLLGLGLGAGYRFKFFFDMFQAEDWFETIDVFVNNVQMSDKLVKKNYAGWGLTTNYGFHKRSGTSFFYGGKISYNLASVTRPVLGDETKKERSLSLGWTSLAFEFGFFF